MVSGVEEPAIGTGAQNTIVIVTQFGDEEPYEHRTDYAAKLCSDLVSGGYDDWFLPSKDELNAIWENLVDEGNGGNSGVGGFSLDHYWSSSDYTEFAAWVQNFNDGQQGLLDKDFINRVRAVRAF